MSTADETARVALIVEQFSRPGAAQAGAARGLADWLARRGHHVTVLAADATALAETGPGLRVEGPPALPRKPRRSLQPFARWVNAQRSAGRFDAVVSLTSQVVAPVMFVVDGLARERFASQALDAGRRRRLDRIAQPRWLVRARAERAERRWLFDGRVHTLLLPTEAMRRRVSERRGQVTPRLAVLPPCPPLRPMLRDDDVRARRTIIRRQLRVPDDALLVVAFGQSGSADGLLRLIDALEHVAADAPPVVLLIAGWIGYGPVRRAAQRGVRDRVRFVGHTADRDGLWSAVDGCATTVDHYHPAAEAFEALAAGVPVLVGREAPAAALVQSRGVGAGVVLDPGLTPPRLAEAIARLDAHRSARDRRALAAAVADDIAAAYDAVDLDALLSEPQVTKDEHGQKGWPRMNADERE